LNTYRLFITQNILCPVSFTSTVIVWSISEVSIPLPPNHMDLYVHNMVQCTLYMARTYRFIWQYGKFLPTWHNLATKLSWFMQASCSYYQLKKIKTYEILELYNNMTFILHLMKIRQLVKKFKCTHTHSMVSTVPSDFGPNQTILLQFKSIHPSSYDSTLWKWFLLCDFLLLGTWSDNTDSDTVRSQIQNNPLLQYSICWKAST
jgi:hypothetical protein